MKNIHAPRYESTVDACINPLLQIIFPAEGSFNVVAHHKVRKEAHGTPQPEAPSLSYFTLLVEWTAGVKAELEEPGSDDSFNPPIHSTLRRSQITTPSADDSTGSIEIPPDWSASAYYICCVII